MKITLNTNCSEKVDGISVLEILPGILYKVECSIAPLWIRMDWSEGSCGSIPRWRTHNPVDGPLINEDANAPSMTYQDLSEASVIYGMKLRTLKAMFLQLCVFPETLRPFVILLDLPENKASKNQTDAQFLANNFLHCLSFYPKPHGKSINIA